ncbi:MULTISPECIES: chloride channel protein [Methylobacterium]|uniref:Voltage-gated ClC-type chloride channel ClcB n=1 Tax=Methylobacterium bullatum TaxID=570505 RepID=A0AAV4Z3M3_9HYPH|nr:MULTISPECIES: chloride channel protein [Methylobacterium]MBD8902389.1 chloride channel protein [Methylobacterium bullatum]TXN29629.1 chloride channel protein [Methylobacterium sp. WL19]GJD38159.1 Voltage-gated ClC-type chloride channel ClcB [Methylobacterium bullatum]
MLVHVPGRLRALVRGSEFGLVILAACVGTIAGIAVSAMSLTTQGLREILYRLPHGARLSASTDVDPLLILFGPAIGGLAIGLIAFGLARCRGGPQRPIVDPIEANALHGGRLSVKGSVAVAAQNVISNGSGASVGLEAGFTQICASLASRLGVAFEMRRSDLRTLVGCGSAAAIAAAFGAPLTGAFYAFELIIGTYSIATLTPVVVAALCGSLVAKALVTQSPLVSANGFEALTTRAITGIDTLPSLALGLACAGLGILIMRGVTLVEQGVRATGLPSFLAPALGGLCVGALALAVSPQILSGGHGALHLHLDVDMPAMGIGALALLFVAKASASAISIGSGFRGGLFFASLFLGALAGKLFAALVAETIPGLSGLHGLSGLESLTMFGLTPLAYAVIGMSALAVAVIGGPLTMTFLALELTGSFPITGLVLVAVIASSMTVRKTFGYSFATWRFHLRGESIRSAHDIGWIRSLTVGALMRREVETTPVDMTLRDFLKAHPLGSPSRVVLVDGEGRYAGIVLVPEAHALATVDGEAALAEAMRYADVFLTADMNAKQAATAFDGAESEALAVVDDLASRRVVGLLTESHTLKRYTEELDRQRRAIMGESG